DLAVQVPDPFPDPPALDLDLLLAKTTAGPYSPTPTADPAAVGIGADEARQEVMQPGRLDLETTFVGARMLGEDLEDDLGPIHHARLDLELEIALLARAEVLVADHHVELALELQVAQRGDLACADEVRRVHIGAPLHVGADHFGARGPREVGQLDHLLPHDLWRDARQQDPDEIRPLARAPGRDQSGDLRA